MSELITPGPLSEMYLSRHALSPSGNSDPSHRRIEQPRLNFSATRATSAFAAARRAPSPKMPENILSSPRKIAPLAQAFPSVNERGAEYCKGPAKRSRAMAPAQPPKSIGRRELG